MSEHTRAERFEQAGILAEILWEEKYSEDKPGDFARARAWLETASTHDIFDMWLRGKNIVGYAGSIMYALSSIRKVVGKEKR